MNEQPEALMLVKAIDDVVWFSSSSRAWGEEAAAELRRLHEVNQELVGWLTNLKSDIAGDRKLRERFGVSFLAALESSIAKAKGESNE